MESKFYHWFLNKETENKSAIIYTSVRKLNGRIKTRKFKYNEPCISGAFEDLRVVYISKNNGAGYWLGTHFAKLVYNPTAGC